MTTFYVMTKDSDPAGGADIVVDHEDRVYFYVDNTELWHHSAGLEVQLDTNDADWTHTEVPVAVVPALLRGVGRIDRRGYGGSHLRDLFTQPADALRTSAELGILTATSGVEESDWPSLPEGLGDLLEKLREGESRLVARIVHDPLRRSDPARDLAAAITAGTEPSLRGIPLRADCRTEDRAEVVEVTRLPADGSAPSRGLSREMRESTLARRRIFSQVPDQDLVTLAAQTCGSSLDPWDMKLSMLVLDEVEGRCLLPEVIAHLAERKHRGEERRSEAEAATEAAMAFDRWRNEAYPAWSGPHPRHQLIPAARLALRAVQGVDGWVLIDPADRGEIVATVLDELRSDGGGVIDDRLDDDLLRLHAHAHLSGPVHEARVELVREMMRRHDGE